MFKYWGFLLCFFVTCSCSAENRPFRFAVNNVTSPPYAWIDKCNGELHGAVLDILEKVFEGVDIAHENVFYRSDAELVAQLRNDLINGKIDGVVLPARTYVGLVSFTDIALLERNPVVVTRAKEMSSPINLLDLKGRRGGIRSNELGSSGLDPSFVSIYEELKLSNVTNVRSGFSRLLNNELDFFISGELVVKGLLWESVKSKDLMVSELTDKVYKPLYLAIAKNSPFLGDLPALETEIASVRKRGLERLIYRNNMNHWISQRNCAK